MNRHLLLTSTLLLALAACGDDMMHQPNTPGGGSSINIPRLTLTNGGAAPFAAAGGDFAFIGASTTQGIAATQSGLLALQLDGANAGMPLDGYQPWVLTSSSAFGAAASSIVVPEAAKLGGKNYAFFLPNGQPQLGVVEIVTGGQEQGQVLTEAALAEPLASSFPSALAATDDGLWIVDAVFGPGSSVRYYPFASMTGVPPRITEGASRRFTPSIGDVNADQIEDFASLGKFALANEGTVGLVSFSFLAPAPAGAAGGVLAFDTATGAELGRFVLPITATSSTSIEFVGAVAATSDHIVVVSAHKSPNFEDIGGTVALYKVTSWSPFKVVDADPATLYDQPESAVATSLPNPVGLAIRGKVAVVVDAPFFAEGAVDLIAVQGNATIGRSLPLGSLYSMGYSVPGDPKISSDQRAAFIPAEVGLLRVEFAD